MPLVQSVFLFHLYILVTCWMLIFWPYGCFFPFKCQVVRINTIDDFHFCFIRIVFQMLFKVPELPQTLPLAQVYTIFTFMCHKTFSSRSFSLPLTNVVRQILWFPDGFFLIVQQNHKPNYGSSRKSASSNLHLQLCTREREREREIWSVLCWWPGLPITLSLGSAGPATYISSRIALSYAI